LSKMNNEAHEKLLFEKTDDSLRTKVEAIIFASPKPISLAEIHEIIDDDGLLLSELSSAVSELMDFYQERAGGFRLQNVNRTGYQFRTADSLSELMQRMCAQRPRPLSRAAQETLAIIAYRQPVTRADIEFIRGVDAGSILKNLLEKGLIRCVGRKEVAGRPMKFGTTDEFLRVYRLEKLSDMPPLDSFQPAVDIVQKALKRIEESEDEGQEEEDSISQNSDSIII